MPLFKRYEAIVWTELPYGGERGDRPFCEVAVGLVHGECGNTSGMEAVATTVRTDDPDRRLKVTPEVERILAGAGWELTGRWGYNGNVLTAGVRHVPRRERQRGQDLGHRPH